MNIVLAHGFLGFKQLLGVEYFNGVSAHLEQQGHQVLVTQVDPLGNINERGSQLGQQISARFGQPVEPAQKVHIIAHSMGGLDARFCLSPRNPGNIASLVASLTTIGTPHRGSPVADLLHAPARLAHLPELIVRPVKKMVDELTRHFTGLHDLTTENTARFDDDYPDHAGVRYFAVGGQGRLKGRATCELLWLTHALVQFVEGANDGLVSVESAKHGETITWDADHADDIGHDLDNLPTTTPIHFQHLPAYTRLVERLAHL